MRRCLVVGTINRYPAPDGWEYVHVDASGRGIWDPEKRRVVPIDVRADVRDLPFEDATVDRVQLWHVLEHLSVRDAPVALAEIRRVLRPGGELDVEVPDMDGVVREWVAGGDRRALLQIIYGDPFELGDDELMAHRYGYDEEGLAALLDRTGFEPGERTTPDLRFRAVRR